MPLSSCLPRSSRTISSPATRSRTIRDTISDTPAVKLWLEAGVCAVWRRARSTSAAVCFSPRSSSSSTFWSKSPLIPAGWLRDRQILVSVTTLALASFALFGAIFLVSLYLQDVRGYSAVQAGVRMLPLTMTTLFVAPTAGKIAARWGTSGVLLAGLTLTGVATGSLTQLGVHSGYGWFGVRLAVLGTGLALALPTVVTMLIRQVPADRVGVGSGLVTMSRQFGGALGLAVLASIGSRVAADTFTHRTALASLRGLVAGGQIGDVRRLAGAPAAAAATQSFLEGFTVAMWLATAAVAIGLLVAAALTRTGARPAAPAGAIGPAAAPRHTADRDGGRAPRPHPVTISQRRPATAARPAPTAGQASPDRPARPEGES